tara:strand:- start:10339 stop:10584 length:246 start_codon:yes stop_codon:yes gene_type:complete
MVPADPRRRNRVSEAEIQERIAALEQRNTDQERRLAVIELKLDKLIEYSAYGKSSIRILIMVGSVLSAVAAAAAYVWDKIN